MTSVNRFRLALVGLVFMITVPAWAGEPAYELDIEPQPLAKALKVFAEQSGLQVVYYSEIADGEKSPEVSGTMTAATAMTQLLAGTDLTFDTMGEDTVVVETTITADQGGDSDSKNSLPTPVLMAQLASSRAQPTTNGSVSSESVTSVVTGKVTDARTGSNLKGALITIEETGQTTSTDDLGEFRFPGVPEGIATITVSYLGYANQSTVTEVRGPATSQNFALRGGSAVEEIVVFGQRSARALALNQERTAPNVTTVVSSDLLGEFGGQTIAETLRRAPGVSFQRDPFTGDGTNIVIRGLEPDLNAVRLNGVELPEGSGAGRSANLGNILTESISEVKISKSLLASQDSAGTGGLVEISTKSPLDRDRRFASFSIEGAKRGSGFNEEFSASGTVSARFGPDDNVGVSASVQYRDTEIIRAGYNVIPRFGEYLPLQVDGQPTIRDFRFIDPRTPFPFEPGVDGVYTVIGNLGVNFTDSSSLGATLGAAWNIGGHTDLRFDYQRSGRSDERVTTTAEFRSSTTYSPRPVAALNGETRRALRWPGVLNASDSYGYIPENREETDVFTLNGQTDIDAWSFSYSAAYTSGTARTHQFGVSTLWARFTSADADLLLPEAVDPVEGIVVSPFPRRSPNDRSISIPLLTPEASALINDPSNFGFRRIIETSVEGENSRFAGDFSAAYNIERGIWKNIQIGGAVELSEFSTNASQLADSFTYRPAVGRSVSYADVGLRFDEPVVGLLGLDGAYSVIGRDSLANFLNALPSIAIDEADAGSAGPGDFVRFFQEGHPSLDATRTKENEFSAFLQTELQIGKLQVIPGVRLSHFDIETIAPQGIFVTNEDRTRNFEAENRLSGVVTTSAKQTKLLPRILANYRHSEDLIFRFGYFQSIARPQIRLLSRDRFFLLLFPRRYGPDSNQRRLSIGEGNPNLQPARTDSFDLSAEWYDGNLGVLKLGVFYKRINNLLESNVTQGEAAVENIVLPDDPIFQDFLDNPDDWHSDFSKPANNESVAEIWGLEAAFEHQFTYLPGIFSGLGVFANYTYTDSSKDQPVLWSFSPVEDANGDVVDFEPVELVFPDIRFNNQSPHSGSVGLTYSGYGIDANILYTAQTRKRTTFRSHGLSNFEEGFSTLDARIEYRFAPRGGGYGRYRIFFEGADLLRGTDDPGLELTRGEDDGVTPKYFTSERYFGGRQLRIGLIAQF